MPDNDELRDTEVAANSSSGGIKTVLIIFAVLGLLGLLCAGGGIAALMFGVSSVREAANKMKSQNNMKQIMLAMHNYDSAYDNLPLILSRSSKQPTRCPGQNPRNLTTTRTARC